MELRAKEINEALAQRLAAAMPGYRLQKSHRRLQRERGGVQDMAGWLLARYGARFALGFVGSVRCPGVDGVYERLYKTPKGRSVLVCEKLMLGDGERGGFTLETPTDLEVCIRVAEQKLAPAVEAVSVADERALYELLCVQRAKPMLSAEQGIKLLLLCQRAGGNLAATHRYNEACCGESAGGCHLREYHRQLAVLAGYDAQFAGL